MKRSLAVLLLAVLLPSVLLGWLAVRSADAQQLLMERQTAEAYQKVPDMVAATARALVNDERRAFAETVQRLIATENPRNVAADFTAALSRSWDRKAVGFATGSDGRLLCPTSRDAANRKDCQQFLWDNGAFLGNKIVATVYPVAMEELNRPELVMRNRASSQYSQQTPAMSKAMPRLAKADSAKAASQSQAPPSADEAGLLVMKDAPAAGSEKEQSAVRNVAPQQQLDSPDSQLTWATAGFRQLTAEGDAGVINRFIQDRLNMIFWVRPAQAPDLVFGCLIDVENLRDLWPRALSAAPLQLHAGLEPEFVLAMLDDKTHPVSTQSDDHKARDWKRPFVATEIGEALPHWEAALYLRRSALLHELVGKIRPILYSLTAVALAVIACGGWLVLADTRRQLALAQKKTDFVSNVSHELKTPLTSIRMFAELMHGGRADPARHAQYLRIIMVEAERLTRLINNVLDFARLERRQRRLDLRPLDLHALIENVWEGHELHLRESGFATRWDAAPPPYPVVADGDAIAQVIVNLLSNAEKYSGERREITLHSYLDGDSVFVSVLDRGSGVPPGEEAKIFQAFYRAHDSLSSGIQGTGLGLTLAQRLAREHGGEVAFEQRAEGGSRFTLRLPLGGG